MRIGLTYDLRDDYLAAGYGEEETAELDRPETIDAIAEALRALGHSPQPVGNLAALAGRLLAGERWDLVFNIAEGLYGVGRESQVPALLDAWRIPYTFSDPLVLALTLHKGMAKHVVRDCGVATPAFRVVADESDLGALELPFPVFCKPVAEGSSKGVSRASRVLSREALSTVCRDLLARFRQPVLVEAYLPGREFTVGLLGTGRDAAVLGVLEVVLRPGAEQEVYSYHNKEHYDELVEYRLVDDADARAARGVALAAWRALGCRDGGRVDVRLDGAGHPHFLEVNPLAGLHPERSDLAILARQVGLGYLGLIERILKSARGRLAPPGLPDAAPVAG
jgi:D-alanine-D-alanine ligase